MKLAKFIDSFGIIDNETQEKFQVGLNARSEHELQKMLADLKRKENDQRRKSPLSAAEIAALKLIPQILEEQRRNVAEASQADVHAAAQRILEKKEPTPDMVREVERAFANVLAEIQFGATPDAKQLQQAMHAVQMKKKGAVFATLLGLEQALGEALLSSGNSIEEYPELLKVLKDLLSNPLRFSGNERLALIMAANRLVDHPRVATSAPRGEIHIYRNLASELKIAALDTKFVTPDQFSTLSLQNGEMAESFVKYLAGVQDLAAEVRLQGMIGHKIVRSSKDEGDNVLVTQLHYLIESPDNPDDNVYLETCPMWVTSGEPQKFFTTSQHTRHFGKDLVPGGSTSIPQFNMPKVTPSGTFTKLDEKGRRQDPPKGISDILHQRSIESQKISIRLQNDLIRELQISCPELLSDPIILANCPVIRKNNELYLVHFESLYTQVTIPSILQRCGDDETEALLGNSQRDQARFGLPVLYQIPTIDDIQRDLFNAVDIDGRFNITEIEGVPDDSGETTVIGATEERDKTELHPIPRMESLCKVLLTERVHATFAWDEHGKCIMGDHCDFANIQPGHYVIVTTNRGIRLVISNDASKGTVILKNTGIPPEQFIGAIRTKELVELHGGTTIQFHTPEQFEKALRTVIPSLGELPKTVYPIDTKGTFPTPLDEGRFETLKPDMEFVASHVEKNPWELVPGDFARILSGDHEWTYGGTAHGTTFLNRLARDFRLDAVEAAKRLQTKSDHNTGEIEGQNWKHTCSKLRAQFARTILQNVLCEMYPEARTPLPQSTPE